MSDFDRLIEFIISEVNKNLKNLKLPNKPTYLYQPIRYAIDAKGKRFRPILVHLSGRSTNVDPDALMNISLAIELLHSFTLVHDDIMDNDTLRHGKITIHEKWDSSTAILAGDGIYTLAQIVLNDLPENINKISKYFNKTTLEICEGQALDKEFEHDKNVTEDMYLDMIEKKTGALLGASAVLPAIYNGEKGKLIDSYEQFGRCLGKGFQIHDDILELTADSQIMGKSLGSDITEGKQTLMVIKARNEYPDKWNDIISSSDNQEQFNNICKFFKKTGILEESRSIANSYFNYSIDSLNNLEGVNTDELVQLVELIKKRNY